MKTSSLILVAMLLSAAWPGVTGAQVHISGPLTGVLVADIYLVDDSIYVPVGEALTIEPGVSLLFSGYFNFRIYGHLSAVGTETDSIFFVPAPAGDSLRSITFQAGSSDSSAMAYWYISGCAESAVNVYAVSVTIEHCTIVGNTANWGGGIYCSFANATISECVITDNTCRNNGGGIYCTSSSPSITNCLVSGNLCNTLPTTSSGMGGGGICANHSSSPTITNCTINDNHSLWHGGGLSITDNSWPTIAHCVISSNLADLKGGGIACFQSANANIVNCTLSGNTGTIFGGGVYDSVSAPDLVNTIVEGSSGGGFYVEGLFDISIAYCDFYGNPPGNFFGTPPELGEKVTVNSNGDSCDAFYNIFLDPLFENAPAGNYHLQAASPCIDAGDPASPLDPDSTVADMGAFYYDHIGYAPNENNIPATFAISEAYPNPFNGAAAIRFRLPTASHVTLIVHDIEGRLVTKLVDGWLGAGEHVALFDGTGLASAIYIYRLEAGGSGTTSTRGSGKMVLLK